MRFFEDFKISNGLAVHLWPTDKFRSVHLQVFLHNPLSDETVTFNNLLSAVLTRGTADYPETRQFNTRLDELYGASVSYAVSRRGERGLLSLWAGMADIETGGVSPIKVLARLLSSVMFDPAKNAEGLLRQDYISQEKSGIANDMAALRDDKDAWADFRLCANMCKDEPYGIHPYGDDTLLKSIGPEPLTSWWSRVMPGFPADIFAVGDFDVVEALDEIEKSFRGRIRGDSDPGPAFCRIQQARAANFISEGADTVQAKLVIGWRAPTNWADDSYPSHALANHIFGQYSQSRLFMNVREREGMAYSVGSRIEPTKGLIFAHAGIDAAKKDRAIEVMLAEQKALAAGDVTEKELDEAKKSMALGIRMSADSPSALCGREMTGIVNKRRLTPEEAVARISGVTAEEVAKAASGWTLDTVFALMPEDAKKEAKA